jgi:peptidoglycan/LPS O-acetylase OafA/YrhL
MFRKNIIRFVFHKRYIANDFQFHLLAPILLIPFILNRRRLTYVLLCIVLLVNIITTISIISTHPGLENGMSDADTISLDFFEKIYITPWCRIGPFLIGMMTKLILEQYHSTLSLIKIILYTIISIMLAMICIYFPFYSNSFPKFVRILYQSLSHQCWAIAIGWLIIVCFTNHGGLVNRILSWSIWTILARLSYSIYLIHTTIILSQVYNRLSTIHYQTSVILNTFISQTILTLLASVFIVILVESPFNLFEKQIRKYYKEKKQILISHQNYGTIND